MNRVLNWPMENPINPTRQGFLAYADIAPPDTSLESCLLGSIVASVQLADWQPYRRIDATITTMSMHAKVRSDAVPVLRRCNGHA
jgi:hypothetical protein